MSKEKSLQNLKAGSNKKWHHTPTEQIRVPSVFAPKLVEIAKELDSYVVESLVDPALAITKVVVDGKCICVSFPYDPGIVERVKLVEPRGKFLPKQKTWIFPLSAAVPLLKEFTDFEYLDPELYILEIRQEKAEIIKAIQEEQRFKDLHGRFTQLLKAAALGEKLPCGWKLFNHQKKGVEWLLARIQGTPLPGAILADHMGLGKTITALVAAKTMAKVFGCTVIVVCPSSLRSNWEREAQKVGTDIITYSWAKMPQHPKDNFVLIADEAHYAQNPKAKRTKKLLALSQDTCCLAIWLLTGTPIKNGRPINLLPLLQAISHPLVNTKRKQWQYQRLYCNAHHQQMGSKTVWNNSGASNLKELAEVTKNGILRRTKDDCLDLPSKQRILTLVSLNPSDQKLYNDEIMALKEDYQGRIFALQKQAAMEKKVSSKASALINAEALVTLGFIRKISSTYKVASAQSLAEELLEQGQQVVIFTEFLESARQLHHLLEGSQVLTGDTPVSDRQKIVDDFQSGNTKVFIGTIKAGGVGLTLTASSHVILLDRPWTPGDAEQAEDRCHRIGQGSTVFCHWLQLGELDTKIDRILEQKEANIKLVLQGKEQVFEDVQDLGELAKQLLESLC